MPTYSKVPDFVTVPGLYAKFINRSQVITKGFLIKFDKKECEIIDQKNNKKIAKKSGRKQSILISNTKANYAFKNKQMDKSMLQHLEYVSTPQKLINIV